MSATSNAQLCQQIADDFRSFLNGGKVEVASDSTSVTKEFRDLGRWVLPDGMDEDDEDSQDYDWEEWAYGEYDKYMKRFNEFIAGKSWENAVEPSLQTGEKNYCYFTLKLK